MANVEPRPGGIHGDNREQELLDYIFSQPNLSDLKGQPDNILDAIDEYARTKAHLMNIGPTKGDLISSVIAKRKPSVMVELGGYVGYSAIRFGDALRRAGGKQYLSLEINSTYAAVANKLVDLAGLSDIVRIIIAPAHLSLARLVHDHVIDHIELLFMDHFKDRYLPDLWLIERLGLLKPGVSMIVADNIGRGPTLDYLAWLQTDPADKRARVEKSGARGTLNRAELKQAVQANSEDAAVAALENVAGDPDLKYETEVHDFSGRHGHKDGVAITEVKA